ELDREAAHVASEVGRALITGDGREADEGLGLLARALKEIGLGDVGERLISLEESVGAEAARMHDSLGDALVVEMKDFLAEMMILEQCRTTASRFEGVLVVGDRH